MEAKNTTLRDARTLEDFSYDIMGMALRNGVNFIHFLI